MFEPTCIIRPSIRKHNKKTLLLILFTIESEDGSNDPNYTDGDESDNMSILTDGSAEKTVDYEELTQL
jgi:hypothetical protein